jgi:hypothetical protein
MNQESTIQHLEMRRGCGGDGVEEELIRRRC